MRQARGKGKSARAAFNIRLTCGIKYDKQAKVYVTSAPALQVYSQGTTEARAKRALRSAATMFLGIAYEKGLLDTVLRGCGFSPVVASAEARADEDFIQLLEEPKVNNAFDITVPVLERLAA